MSSNVNNNKINTNNLTHTHVDMYTTVYSFNVLKIFLHVKIMKIKKRAILSRTGHGREGERGKEGGREKCLQTLILHVTHITPLHVHSSQY